MRRMRRASRSVECRTWILLGAKLQPNIKKTTNGKAFIIIRKLKYQKDEKRSRKIARVRPLMGP
jgi:hypothetical protein